MIVSLEVRVVDVFTVDVDITKVEPQDVRKMIERNLFDQIGVSVDTRGWPDGVSRLYDDKLTIAVT